MEEDTEESDSNQVEQEQRVFKRLRSKKSSKSSPVQSKYPKLIEDGSVFNQIEPNPKISKRLDSQEDFKSSHVQSKHSKENKGKGVFFINIKLF